MYGQHFQQSEYGSTGSGGQSSCSWSAEQGKLFFPRPRSRLRIWSCETGSAVPSRVTPLILHTQADSDENTHGSRFPPARPHIPSTAIGSVPCLSGHATAYRWCSLPRVRRHRASSAQGSSSNGCCLFRFHHGPIFMRLSFPTL